MKYFACLFASLSLFMVSCLRNHPSEGRQSKPSITIVGEMRNVMRKGELFGNINLDTIANKKHLYAVAPLEYLKGEIMIMDGECYVSRATSDTTMIVEKTFQAKAPFFVSSTIDQWHEVAVPDSVQSVHQLEIFLDETTKSSRRPFAFKISGLIEYAEIHIVNLPDETQVRSLEDVQQNTKTYSIQDTGIDIVGFFSVEHAGVFVHHDSYVHMHLITRDKKMMGHLEQLTLTKGKVKLFLPEGI